jgi:hypothetical protein
MVMEVGIVQLTSFTSVCVLCLHLFFLFLPEDSSVYHLYNVQVSFLFECCIHVILF